MVFSTNAIEKIPDPIREEAGLPLGEDGGYFVGEIDDYATCVFDFNHAPKSQPGLHCDWRPSDDGNYIGWDGTRKFYWYREWLWYLIDNFLKPWGYILNGEVTWKGEDENDRGSIIVKDNKIINY